MLGKFFKKSAPTENKAHHFIFIESPLEVVAPQVAVWAEAEWWPARSPLQIFRMDSGTMGPGTRFKQRLSWVVPWKSSSEISRWEPPQLIERTFKKGPLVGRESFSVEGRYNGTKVMYELNYRVKGLLNVLLWKWVFHNIHDRAMKLALAALRDHCLAQRRL